MTNGDIFLWALAAAQLTALAAMGLAGLQLVKKGVELKRRADPALSDGKKLAARGKRLAGSVKQEVTSNRETVMTLTSAVKRRWETTRSIASEIGPAAREGRAHSEVVVRDATKVARNWGDVLQRVGRVRRSAEAARRAARDGGTDG